MPTMIRFFYRPVGWLGVPAPGTASRVFSLRHMVYEEQSPNETEAQYNVDGVAAISRVSSDNHGRLTYYYNAIGVPIAPDRMSAPMLAAKDSVDQAWQAAMEAGQVR